jgi:hypothetical protein
LPEDLSSIYEDQKVSETVDRIAYANLLILEPKTIPVWLDRLVVDRLVVDCLMVDRLTMRISLVQIAPQRNQYGGLPSTGQY